MANLKEIRRRIGSVKNTQKITRAMKMVAAAKLRKAQDAAERFRDYSDLMSSLLSEVAAGAATDDHPLLERRDVKNSLVLVIAADKGLCGGFNSNLCRMVTELSAAKEMEPLLSIVGGKAISFFTHQKANIKTTYPDVYDDENGYAAAAQVARELAALYESGKVDSIEIAYNEMVSVVSQTPVVRQLLPVKLPEKQIVDEKSLSPAGFIFEPKREALLGRLLPKYVEVEVYRALVESIAAEHAARMTAMETATNNADDMIENLTLIYNRARQSAITSELMDIVGGAEALE